MAKKNKKEAAVNAAALSQDEFQKLTPEEQVAELQKQNEALADANRKLVSEVKSAKATKKDELPIVEDIEEDPDNKVEGGNYQFTAPSFTWDDGSEIKSRELVADYVGNDEKASEKAQVVIAKLLQRKSGLLVKI